MPFDPFGDHDTRGHLRNFAGEKDPARIKRIEHHAFAANVRSPLYIACSQAISGPG